MTDFGEIVTPHDVSQAIEEHIRTWERTALDAIAPGRNLSRRLPKFKSFRHTGLRPEKWDEDALPCCVIVTGPAEASDRGDAFSAFFTVAIAAIAHVRPVASAYGGALAMLMMNQRDLEIGEVAGWGGFDASEIPRDKERTLAMAVSGYTIHVPDALTVGMWPEEPLPDPAPDTQPTYPPDHTAEHINVTVDQLAQEG